MSAPAGPIRMAAIDAVSGGIKDGGPEAVRLLLVGAARLVLAFLSILLAEALSVAILGFRPVSVPAAAFSLLSATSTGWATRPGGKQPARSRPADPGDEGQAP